MFLRGDHPRMFIGVIEHLTPALRFREDTRGMPDRIVEQNRTPRWRTHFKCPRIFIPDTAGLHGSGHTSPYGYPG